MAARRLIIVLVLLLAVSVAAAAIAPDRQRSLFGSSSTDSTSTSTTTEAEPEPPSGGIELTARLDASTRKPPTVRSEVGEQLELVVESEQPRQIEIPSLGLLGYASPEAPARFNILFRDAARRDIVDAETRAIVGRLEIVSPREAERKDGGDGPPEEAPSESTAEGQIT